MFTWDKLSENKKKKVVTDGYGRFSVAIFAETSGDSDMSKNLFRISYLLL